MDRAHEPLELLVGGQDDRRGGHLVDVAYLQPDDAVLDVVDDPDAVTRADLGGAFDQLDQPEGSPFSATGLPRSNPNSMSSDSSGASSGRVTSWKTSSSGAWARSSIQRPSEERPQRLSSIE